MAICYVVFLNLPYWLQSSREEISLLLVTKRSTLNEISFDCFLEYFIEDLFKINSNPISLSNGYSVRVNLKASAADNEGNNRLMSVPRAFSTGRSGRYCLHSAKDLQELSNNLSCVDACVNGERERSRSSSNGGDPRTRTVFDDQRESSVRRPMPTQQVFRELTDGNTFFYAVDTFHDFCSNGIFIRILEPIFILFYVETNGNGRVDWERFKNLVAGLLSRYKAINHRNGTLKGKLI